MIFCHRLLSGVVYYILVLQSLSRYLIFHEFAFTPRFVLRLLSDNYFRNVTILSSPPTQGDPHHLFPGKSAAGFFKVGFYLVSKTIEVLSLRRSLISPSIEVIAFKE